MTFNLSGKLSALRTFRVLRALKTVAVVPGSLSSTTVRLYFADLLTYLLTYLYWLLADFAVVNAAAQFSSVDL